MKRDTSLAKGFTLIEVMIVVAIIGMLAAIAIPSAVRARANAQKSACIDNLRQIDSAKQSWALENKVSSTATPADSLIQVYMGRGPNGALPICPADSSSSFDTSYSVNNLQTAPSCQIVPASHIFN